jgi:flagellar biosynthesis protein FlhF
MHVKSYFASTIAATMEMARRELGPDAMLIKSTRTGPASAHLGRYEVVFGGDQPIPRAENSEIAEIRRQLSGLRLAMTRSKSAAGPEIMELEAMLIGAGIDADLADELAAGVSPSNALAAELEARIRVDSSLGPIIALIGPPGRGKTTTLVKIAVARGLAERVPIRLLSMDTLRVAAAEQLRSYSAILGAPFQTVESAAALDQALADGPAKRLTLIDTPGFGPRDREEAAELARCFTAHPEIQVHLTLRADAKSADLQRAVQTFSIFKPSRLIFTGLDETECVGSAYSLALRTGLPISFFTCGQQIPEDLYAASVADFVQKMLQGMSPIAPLKAFGAAA